MDLINKKIENYNDIIDNLKERVQLSDKKILELEKDLTREKNKKYNDSISITNYVHSISLLNKVIDAIKKTLTNEEINYDNLYIK